MKLRNILLLLSASAMLVAGQAAQAHGSRTTFGVYVGPSVMWGPAWGHPVYGPPFYYPPSVVVVPAAPPPPPPVYIEQSQPAAESQQYWHFCKSAKAYYPYVKECPEGWQRVLPQPEQR
jgi:hypothetical protein